MKRRFATAALLLFGLLGIVWLGIAFGTGSKSGHLAAANTTPAPEGTPVFADVARVADTPIYLTGLGTVQAANSVLVKSRVDGQILKIGFVEGQEVHAGDVLAEVDPRPFAAALAQANAAKLKDQAQLDNARLDLARSDKLVGKGVASTQQHDTDRALVAQLAASVKADQAQIDLAQLQLDYSQIRSPIDGRAGIRLLDAGNIVRASDTTGIVAVNQISPIVVSFALPASSLPEIRGRLKDGDIPVTAEDSDGHDLATGKLTVVDNQINASTATITYKASFDNTDEALWPGQFVDIRLLLRLRRNVLTVPITAVLRGPEGTYAFVIGGDHVVEKRPIKVGFSNKTIAIVEEGLAPGEKIVTDGQYRIQSGTRVNVLPQQAEIAASPAGDSESLGAGQ